MILKRVIWYENDACSTVKETMAREHPRGREAVAALESALSRYAEEGATRTEDGLFLRTYRFNALPSLEIMALYNVEWNAVTIVKFAFRVVQQTP